MGYTVNYILVAFILILSTSIESAQAGTVNEIVNRHLAALGGKAAIDKITSLKINATMTLGGMTGSGVTYFKSPDKFRADVQLPVISTSQGCSGEDCWVSNPQGLTHEVGHELKAMMITQMSLQRSDFAEPDKFSGKLTLVAETALLHNDTTGARFFVIEVVPEGGVAARVWIDQETYLMRQVAIQTDLGMLISEFFDYREVAGVQFSHRFTERTDAGFVEAISEIASIEINPELSDTLFLAPSQRHARSDWNLSADSLVIPCDFWRNHLYFQAIIDETGPYNFIFDTGAGGFALSADLVKQLNLEVIGQVEAHGVGGAEQSELYRVKSLSIGELQLDSIPISAIDFGAIEMSGTRKIDGIIGYTLLSRFTVAIDYGSNQIILYPPGTHKPASGSECELTVDFQLPYVDATINDSVDGTFRLDTGSISTLDLNSPFVKENNLVDTAAGDYIHLTAVGVGGTSSGLVGLLDEIEFCGLEQDSVWAGFSLSERGIFAGASTAGNIGAGLLKRFRITFDYAAGKVYFQPNAAYDLLSRARNMAGISFARKNGVVEVVYLVPGHAALGVLQEGDLLIRVDNALIQDMSIPEVERLLVGGNRTVEIEFERGGDRKTAELHLESYF